MKNDVNVKVSFPKGYPTNLKEDRQRVYDCFTFFNEIELLEIRLKELAAAVDYFVIIEANKTFTGKSKPFNYLLNKDKFKKWWKKIIYIQVIGMPKLNLLDRLCVLIERKLPKGPQAFFRKLITRMIGGVSSYKLVEYQRRCSLAGLTYCRDKDIIIGIDVDEIPNPKKVMLLAKFLKGALFVEFEQKNYLYYLNGQIVGKDAIGIGPRACTYKTLKDTLKGKIDFLRTPPYLWRKFKRKFKRKNYLKIALGAWHFSYLGGPEKIRQKLKTLLEYPEAQNKEFDMGKLRKVINDGGTILDDTKIKFVIVDNSFPNEIFNHKKFYAKYIHKEKI